MDTFNANRVLHYMAKGQLISNCLFGVIISALASKERSNQKNKGTLLY